MTPRTLRFRAAASADLARRVLHVAERSGAPIARAHADTLLVWLEGLAASGAVYGRAIDLGSPTRLIGWRRQAAVLVRFTAADMIVLRIYFKGQDWRR